MNYRLSRLFFILSLTILTLLAACSPSDAVPFEPTAKPAPTGITTPITGTGLQGTFDGVFTLTKFAVQGGQLVAVGTLTGEVTNLLTGVVTTITQTIALPVNLTGTCTILELDLGPLNLNLLGLQIDLSAISLDITAQQGGGLLGDLLCSIANLLNNNSPLSPLVTLLNNVLKVLG